MPDKEKIILDLETNIQWIQDNEEHQFTGWANVVKAMQDALLLLLGQPARLLAYEEIAALPDMTVVWEEVRADWMEIEKHYPGSKQDSPDAETSIAPTEKRGMMLYGTGLDTEICPEMLDEDCGTRVRYWSARPSEEQREAAPWA